MAESKEFKVRSSRKLGSMKEVYLDGGGEIPVALSGYYTDANTAQKDIDLYLLNRRDRSPKTKAS